MADHNAQSGISGELRAGALNQSQRNGVMPVSTIGALGILSLGASFLIADPVFSMSMRGFGAVLAFFSAVFIGYTWIVKRRRSIATNALLALVDNDDTPSFLTNFDGQISFKNAAATDRFNDRGAQSLGTVFSDLFANPGAVLFRLQSKAQALGSAREDIVTRKGHVRLSVNAVDDDTYLWRLEDLSDRGGAARAADALSLPMLTAGPSGTVLYMNEAFRRLLGGRAKNLSGVFTNLPVMSGQVHNIMTENGTIESLTAVVPGHGGRSEIYLLPGENISNTATKATDWDAIEELPIPLLKVSPAGEILASNHEARALLEHQMGPTSRMSDVFSGLGRPLSDWVGEALDGRGDPAPATSRSCA